MNKKLLLGVFVSIVSFAQVQASFGHQEWTMGAALGGGKIGLVGGYSTAEAWQQMAKSDATVRGDSPASSDSSRSGDVYTDVATALVRTGSIDPEHVQAYLDAHRETVVNLTFRFGQTGVSKK